MGVENQAIEKAKKWFFSRSSQFMGKDKKSWRPHPNGGPPMYAVEKWGTDYSNFKS